MIPQPKSEMTIEPASAGPPFTDAELHHAYHSLIECEEDERLLCESLSLERFDAWENPGKTKFQYIEMIQEAITRKNYASLKKGIEELARSFKKAFKGSEVVLSGYTLPKDLKPRKNRMFAYVAAEFVFSDGQSVKIMFHSPGGDSRVFDRDNALVSYAYTLNKRDVTHLFAQKKSLSVPQFTNRMTQLLLKNSETFQKSQTNLAETKKQLAEAEAEADAVESSLAQMEQEMAVINQDKSETQEVIYGLESSIKVAKKEKKRLEDLLAQAGAKTTDTGVQTTETPTLWDKPEEELRKTNIGQIQKNYDSLMGNGRDVEALMLMAKAIGAKTNVKEAKALLNRKQKKGELDGHYTDRLNKLKDNLETKMTHRMTSPQPGAAAEPEADASPKNPATELANELEAKSISLQDDPVASMIVSFLAGGHDTLSGVDDEEPERIDSWIYHAENFVKKNKKHRYIDRLRTQLEAVKKHYAALPPQATPEGGDDPVAGLVSSYLAGAEDILSGKVDDEQERIETWIEKAYDFVEANSGHSAVDDLGTQLDAVSDYYTALLSRKAA